MSRREESFVSLPEMSERDRRNRSGATTSIGRYRRKHQFIKEKFSANILQLKLSGSPTAWSLTVEEGEFLNNSKIKLIKEAATKLQASPKYRLLMVLLQGEEANMPATRGLRGGPVTGAYCFDCLKREAIKLRHRMVATARRAIGKRGKFQA